MSMTTCSKNYQCCALCKNWYDPTNSAIEPVNPPAGIWKYDTQAKKKCLVRNIEILGHARCNKFQSKL